MTSFMDERRPCDGPRAAAEPEVRGRTEAVSGCLRISRAIENGDHVEAVRLTRGHLRAATPFVVSRGGQVRAVDQGGRRGKPRG